MIGQPLKPALCCMMVLSVVGAPTSFTLNAQSTSAAGTQSDQTAKLLRAIDQLVEQNRRLQEQNQQLIDEIGALRKLVAARSASETADPHGVKADMPVAGAASNPAMPPITARRAKIHARLQCLPANLPPVSLRLRLHKSRRTPLRRRTPVTTKASCRKPLEGSLRFSESSIQAGDSSSAGGGTESLTSAAIWPCGI